MHRFPECAAAFRALHIAGRPLVLFNAWDVGSARAVAAAGAAAVATSSWSMAAASGFADGEQMPLDALLASARRIVAAVDVPVSVDFEAGYADTTKALGENIAALADTGVVGCNLEDGLPGSGRVRETAEQAERLVAARAAAHELFLNVRTDLFLTAAPERHAGLVDEACRRACAYAEAGADGLFVPGLLDPALVAEVVRAAPLPVNVMLGDHRTPVRPFVEAGVARVSYGPQPYLLAMQALEAAAREVGGQLPGG